MSIGSILVGVAVAILTGAYLARPFRPAGGEGEIDRAIEAWVARAGEESVYEESVQEEPDRVERVEEPINYCSRCGRRVGPQDRFCPGCGHPLQGGTA
jgi:hypothetical protein